MREYGFSLARMDLFLYRRIRVYENPYSRMFYAVNTYSLKSFLMLAFFLTKLSYFVKMST